MSGLFQSGRLDVAMVMVNNAGLGGAERRFAQVFAALRRCKLQVVLVVNETLLRRLLACGALEPLDGDDCLVVPEPLGRLLAGAGSRPSLLAKLDYLVAAAILATWILRRRPRILHVILGGAYVALPLQLLGAAPPAVLSMVCPALRDMVGPWPAAPLYRSALHRAVIVDALSRPIAEAMMREGIAPHRLRVSEGSCVNTERFRPAAQKRPWIVFCGRLVPEKQPLLFLESCALVQDRLTRPDLRFFVLGDGPLRPDVAREAKRLGLEPRIELGWSDDVQSVFSQALLFVSLQRTDNYPSQALLEAMACGTAVVATDVGATARLVDASVGCRVPALAPAVAEAIVEALEDPDRTVAMGVRARERVVREHSMDRYVGYLEQVYQACLQGR